MVPLSISRNIPKRDPARMTKIAEIRTPILPSYPLFASHPAWLVATAATAEVVDAAALATCRTTRSGKCRTTDMALEFRVGATPGRRRKMQISANKGKILGA